MVNLTLTPHRGNGARTFPSTGYLGLTPVSLAGVVRVKIEEDMKAIQASSLVVRVRCYENIGGNHGSSTASAASDKNASSSSSSSNIGSNSYSGNPSTSSGHHSSSCLGGSSTGYSLTDMLKGTSSGSTSSTSSSSASSSSSTSTKGRVLYEKSVTMWTPPPPPVPVCTPTTSTSTPLASRSSSSQAVEAAAAAEEEEAERDSSPHAYPPRRQSPSSSSSAAAASSSADKPVNYGTLGEFTKAWRIVIPPEAVEQGAKSTMVFKNWKIWWAVEAVISHRPQGIHGDRIIKSHQVALLSYAPRSTSAKAPEWISSPSNPHPLAYSFTSSTSTFGSSDPIEFHVQLHKKSSNAETPKKVTLELRREIAFWSSASSESPATPSYSHSFEAAQIQAIREATQKKTSHFGGTRGMHSRSNSGSLANLLPGSNNASRYKSESQEALISTPPPLSNTSSTISTFSYLMPSTPPTSTPQNVEYAESTTTTTSESYFGLFNGGASRKNSTGDLSSASTRHSKYASQHTRHSPPPVTVPLPVPHTSSSSASKRNNNSTKKEDITLATFEVDCAFTSPTWNGKMTGNMPKVKSLYHYALGETCQTPAQSGYRNGTSSAGAGALAIIANSASASSRFYLIPRIHYKNKHSFVELPPLDILFYTVSDEDRRKALELVPKVLAIQKAEARLFGGEELASDKKDRKHKEDKNHKTPTHPASVYTKSRSGHQSSAPLAARPRTSQSVSPKVGTGKSHDPLPALKLPANAIQSLQDETPRLSTVRRRSEQAEEGLDCPRTRQRFASIPDLSPIVGSPYIDAVSPSLSVISTSTSRPRSAVRSRPTTANSTKSHSSRPRSSAGLELNTTSSSAWSTYSGSSGNFASFALDAPAADLRQYSPVTVESTTPVAPALDSASSTSTRTSSASDSSMEVSPKSTSSKENYETGSALKNYTYSPGSITPAAVNGLFADFSGFSLRPPDHMLSQIPLIREELVAPKPTVSSSSRTQSSHSKRTNVAPPLPASNNKRKSTELLAGPDHGHTKMTPSKSANGSTHSSASSRLVAFHEITLASPPASASVNPNDESHIARLSPKARSSTMSKIPSHSSSLDVPSPLVDTGISANNSRRAKSGMSGAFSFFRRSSARI